MAESKYLDGLSVASVICKTNDDLLFRLILFWRRRDDFDHNGSKLAVIVRSNAGCFRLDWFGKAERYGGVVAEIHAIIEFGKVWVERIVDFLHENAIWFHDGADDVILKRNRKYVFKFGCCWFEPK